MQFIIHFEQSKETREKTAFLNNVCEVMSMFFSQQDFGPGVAVFNLTVISMGPLSDHPTLADIPTTTIINKEYHKAQGELNITVKLNYDELVAADGDQIIQLFHQAIAASQPAVAQLQPLEFVHTKFYGMVDGFFAGKYLREITALMSAQKLTPPLANSPRPDLTHIAALALSDEQFWALIGHASAPNDTSGNLAHLVAELAKLPLGQIIGFEVALRDHLAKLNHYQIIALAKIVNDYVSDDSLLQFQCSLIAGGRAVYERVLEPPGLLPPGLREAAQAEWLLSVADRAMELKLGPDSSHEPPRSFCQAYKNYNSGFEIMGEDYDPVDLPKLYPQAWQLYQA